METSISVVQPAGSVASPTHRCTSPSCRRCRRKHASIPVIAPDHSEWVVEVTFDDDANAVGLNVQLRETLREIGQPHPILTVRLLQSLPVGAYVDFARSRLVSGPFGPVSEEWSEAVRNGVRRPGRRGTPDLDYARIADAYVKATNAGETKQAIAERLGMTSQQLTNQLITARQRGLLNKPGRGSNNHELTHKALATLKKATP